MSVLLGFLVSDAATAESMQPDEVIRAMAGEAVIDPSAGLLERRHGGLHLLQRYHGQDSRRRPARSADGSLSLFLDGEIFDHAAPARAAGDHPEGDSDAYYGEAHHCLEVFRRYGIQGFEKLNGSFVIAIYDHGKEELTIANDRFASRPLFYSADDKRVVFGTQLGPLLRFPGMKKELDQQSVFEFFTFQRVLEDRTFLKGISLLPPASALKFKKGSSRLTTYWKMEYRPDYSHSREHYSSCLADAIHDSVAARMRGGKRMGLLLSGGLDSRMVLAASRGIGKLEAITVADHYNREVKTARRIADAAGCEHHFIRRPPDQYVNLLDEAVKIGGGMYPFVQAHYIGLFDSMRERCDLLFHGYGVETFFRASKLPRKGFALAGMKFPLESLKKLSEDSIVDDILGKAYHSLWGSNPTALFNQDYSQGHEAAIRAAISRVLSALPPDASAYNRFDWFAAGNHSRFPSAIFILSIRPYMEERSFAYDNRLLDLYLRTPPEFRADPLLWMRAMERLDGEVARIPDANYGLSPFAPALFRFYKRNYASFKRRLINRNKVYTQASWLNYWALTRSSEKFRELIMATVADAECLNPDIFDTKAIEELASRHLRGVKDHTNELFLLLTFGRWHQLYIS